MAIFSEAFSRRLKFFTIQSIIALERVTFTRDCVMPWAQIRTLRPDFQELRNGVLHGLRPSGSLES